MIKLLTVIVNPIQASQADDMVVFVSSTELGGQED